MWAGMDSFANNIDSISSLKYLSPWWDFHLAYQGRRILDFNKMDK